MTNYSIDEVLPHSAPMILIDSIDEYSELECTCSLTIKTTSMFYSAHDLGIPSYIGAEYMAQAIAAFAGANALDKNSTVNIGFLLGSRKYETTQSHFKLHDRIKIKIEQIFAEDSGLYVFDCKIIDSSENVLALANINVFQPENAEEFLKDIYE